MKTRIIPFPQVAIAVLASIAQIVCVPVIGAERPANRDSEPPSTIEQAVDVRYARANLDLAKLDLRRVVEGNQRLRGLFSAAAVERLRENVAIAEEQLTQALKGEHGHLHGVHLRGVEAAVNIAEAELKRVLQLHDTLPSVYTDLDVERSRAAVKVARLNLERARDPRNFQSEIPHLQWQIEELRQQVLQLQLEVEKLSTRQ